MDQLIDEIKKFAIEIYKELGAGYDEVIYEEALAIELRNKKIPYEVERNTEVFYKGIKVGINRLDFIVDGKLVVELKAHNSITRSHEGQTRSYLKSTNLKNGLIVNFPYPDKDEPDFQVIAL